MEVASTYGRRRMKKIKKNEEGLERDEVLRQVYGEARLKKFLEEVVKKFLEEVVGQRGG